MYTAFYGLREKPFALSPDPRFLYLATPHREALAHLLYGIEQGEGFISVTGEVGTGKTTLCRTLLEQLEDDVQLAFLFNPSRTALELMQSINSEFGLPAEGLGRRSLMQQLNQFLVDQKRAGRRVLLIIDEAQTLSENTLEQVRLLSNLETSREKLIQILLLGQPELDRKLDERGLRQLRQRISVRWQLAPLSAQETRAYVRHRLAVAAGEPKDLFSETALREIHRRTGGVPRLVNQLCDRALLAGYAARAARIGPRIVRAAAREIPDTRRAGEGGRPGDAGGRGERPWLFALGSLALVCLALFAGLQYGRTHSAQLVAGRVSPPAKEASPPAVGANAPRAEVEEVPPLAELIGYVPAEVLEVQDASPDPSPPREPSVYDIADALSGRGTPLTPGDLVPAETLTPAETSLAPGLLGQLLTTRSATAALGESRDALLERFGRRVAPAAPAPSNREALRGDVEARGLVTTLFEGGSIELLRRLDHPVALPLAAATRVGEDGLPRAFANAERWVTLVGFDGARARLAGLLDDQLVTVGVDELEAHWLETGLIVWERFEAIPNLLTEGDAGNSVLWLQRVLSELRYYDGSPTREFDGETRDAVRRFQFDRGLVADGVAGPLTQIALYGELARYPVPRLSAPLAAARASSGTRPADPARPTARPTPEAAPAPRAGSSGVRG